MKICISCVVDDSPKFRMQSINFIATARQYIKNNISIILHLVGDHPDWYVNFCNSIGVTTIHVSRYGTSPHSKYCNKLRQLDSQEVRKYDVAILCDTDIAFTDDISSVTTSDTILAKATDTSTPPISILEKLYSNTPITMPHHNVRATVTNEKILPYYCNGGIYIIPTIFLDQLAPRWISFANRSLDTLPAEYKHYSDQVGFMLAMQKLQIKFEYLDAAWNFPLHFSKDKILHLTQAPNILHYHDRLDDNGFLTNIGIPHIDSRIHRANTAIANFRRSHFSNAVYWDYRYTHHPAVGSGAGSRAQHLLMKRNHIYPVISINNDKTVLDVGCGDLEVMCESDAKHYTGIDVSPGAIQLAQTKRPDWTFFVGDIQSLQERHDIVICLDVLIHQPSFEQYQNLVTSIINYSKDFMIVSGYSSKSTNTNVTFYYEPIEETFLRDPRIGAMTLLCEYRDCSLFLIERKKRKAQHPNDISLYSLAMTLTRAPYPDIARKLIEISREKLGFFTKTATRALEYSWLAHKIDNPTAKSILEIGAGVNPIPIWLASHGANIVTVDTHSKQVTLDTLPSCNEWGFFDYKTITKNAISYNNDASTISEKDFDVIYSISVIEHMPKSIRLSTIASCSTLLKTGGALLLTVDLVPKTRRLWNYSENIPVDPRGEHGTLEDLLNELERSGFKTLDITLEVEVPGSRTDIAMIHAIKM